MEEREERRSFRGTDKNERERRDFSRRLKF